MFFTLIIMMYLYLCSIVTPLCQCCHAWQPSKSDASVVDAVNAAFASLQASGESLPVTEDCTGRLQRHLMNWGSAETGDKDDCHGTLDH